MHPAPCGNGMDERKHVMTLMSRLVAWLMKLPLAETVVCRIKRICPTFGEGWAFPEKIFFTKAKPILLYKRQVVI
jgi:hypothetical protein